MFFESLLRYEVVVFLKEVDDEGEVKEIKVFQV